MINTKMNKTCDDEPTISTSDFFAFMKLAYQIARVSGQAIPDTLNESLEVLDDFDLNCSINNRVIDGLRGCDADVDPSSMVKRIITEKLYEIIDEGLLDSVLPYLVPREFLNRSAAGGGRAGHWKSAAKNVQAHTPIIKEAKKVPSDDVESVKAKPRKLEGKPSKVKPEKTTNEIEIHVYDEVKKLKRDFTCAQELLLNNMGYFVEVTAGQKLEDMDISVHCDVGVFEWLIQWIKRDQILVDDRPSLTTTCVIPILASAAFLQMDTLVQTCLTFCYDHLNDIVKTSANLNCLTDAIVARLASMYTNTELERVRDRKEKILPRLYGKMIVSLAEAIPQSLRGHWSTLASLIKCAKCGKLVTKDEGPYIPCVSSAMRLTVNGDVLNAHTRDLSWNLNEHIVRLYRDLRTWRRVYWRLWGSCHFLTCQMCASVFPVVQMAWCCAHAEAAQFFNVDNRTQTTLPVGRYPCCGARAYRFEAIRNPTNGCRFVEHKPITSTTKQTAIYTLFVEHRQVIEQPAPQIMIPERLTSLVAREADTSGAIFDHNEIFWWEGIELAPARDKLGLLGKMLFVKKPDKLERTISVSSSESDTGSTTSSSSSTTTTSTPPAAKPRRKLKRKIARRIRTQLSRQWSAELSPRTNQDLQRAFEESATQNVVEFLTKRTGVVGAVVDGEWTQHLTPTGGVYYRLEAEWSDVNKKPAFVFGNPRQLTAKSRARTLK